jgi:GNAT superfamily N-acetyltransferase
MIPESWDDAVPDLPRWVEMRSLLLHDEAALFGDPGGGIIVGNDGLMVGVVGRPDPEVLVAARVEFAAGAQVLVVPETLDHALALIPEGHPRRAVLHRLTGPFVPAVVEGVDVGLVDDAFMASLGGVLASEVGGAFWAASISIDGEVVSVCGAGSITESLWDVGIDTIDGHRRRGHARACYLALASYLAEQGLEPVWGAYEDNDASLAMAHRLGFVPVDELWVIEIGRD